MSASMAAIFGSTEEGGQFGRGRVFTIDQFGHVSSAVPTLGWMCRLPFKAASSRGPTVQLLFTAAKGGANDQGAVLRLKAGVLRPSIPSPDRMEAVLKGGLALSNDGNFYGATTAAVAYLDTALFSHLDAAGNPRRTFVPSPSPPLARSRPSEGLLKAADGHFYGVTTDGGEFDRGTVFRINPMGVISVVHSFNDWDGAEPHGLSLRQRMATCTARPPLAVSTIAGRCSASSFFGLPVVTPCILRAGTSPGRRPGSFKVPMALSMARRLELRAGSAGGQGWLFQRHDRPARSTTPLRGSGASRSQVRFVPRMEALLDRRGRRPAS